MARSALAIPKVTIANGAMSMTSWPVAAEQLAVVDFLLSPATHGGAKPGYLETAVSHIFLAGGDRFILFRPLKTQECDWRTPEARWSWCTERWMAAFDAGEGARYSAVAIMRRNAELHLGGPGTLEDCILVLRANRSPRHTSRRDKAQDSAADPLYPPHRVIGE